MVTLMNILKSTRFRRLMNDEAGTVSVEFVVAFPLLMLWLAGSFVYFEAYRSNSLTGKVAYTVADITSRYTEVTDTELAALYDVQKKLLPNRVSEAWMRISSICKLGTSYEVLWSYVGDDTSTDAGLPPRLSDLTSASVPDAIMPVMEDHDTVILVEMYASWQPVMDWVGLSPLVWTSKLVSKPRSTQYITHDPEGPETVCPDPTVVAVGGPPGGEE